MHSLQILLLLSAAIVIPGTSAYSYVVRGCKAEEEAVYKKWKIDRFIDEFVMDAEILANDAYKGWPGPDAPIGEDPATLKQKQPLIPDLFGSITAQEWTDIDHVVTAANELAMEGTPKSGPAKVLISCEADMETKCTDGALMQTRLGEGGDAAKDLILLCPSFWEDVLGPEPLYYGLLTDKSIPVCDKKPIDLGAIFAGRLYYHETIHTLAGTEPFPEDDWEFKDRGYLVDENKRIVASIGIRVGSVEHTFYSKQNPDTYSFWALLRWQQRVCSWKPVWPWSARLRSPMFTIPTYMKGPGLYGKVPETCPGRPQNPISGDWLTKPTEDVVNGLSGLQQISWCKLVDQSKACTGSWIKDSINVLKDGRSERLSGCFLPSVKAQNIAVDDDGQVPLQAL